MAGANQQRADHTKPIHKPGANHEQVRAALDHLLRMTNFVTVSPEAAQDPATEAASQQIEQLVADHAA